jgi:hypothetical protein
MSEYLFRGYEDTQYYVDTYVVVCMHMYGICEFLV